MTMTVEDRRALEALEVRLRAILPEEYQDAYEDVQPVSMGSAGLKYGADGKVAWNEIWATFCDLAMAGGPPHRGTLLEPGSRAAIDAQPDRIPAGRGRDRPGRQPGDRPRGAGVADPRLGPGDLSQRSDGGVAAPGDRDGERVRPV